VDAAAIETANLSCRYGRRTEAVRDLTLRVRSGTIFALLGPNGAGKTTTIRVLMNVLRRTAGSARVLGIDAQRLGPTELAQIGYVSENQQLPAWMTVADFLSFCRPFYPTWDEEFSRMLIADFRLPLDMKIRHLSRGMRVKAALVSALAFRPRVLVLDEPFSGLDPVVRDDLVQGVLQLAGQEQWTVFISSHDLDEVERLVDDVGFIDNGRLVLTEPLAELQNRFRSVEVTAAGSKTGDGRPVLPSIVPDGWIGVTSAGRMLRFVDARYSPDESLLKMQALFPGARVEARPMTLREIFVAIVRQERAGEVLQ
jgi:ABC-2 type transport system ATP-binding protein